MRDFSEDVVSEAHRGNVQTVRVDICRVEATESVHYLQLVISRVCTQRVYDGETQRISRVDLNMRCGVSDSTI